MGAGAGAGGGAEGVGAWDRAPGPDVGAGGAAGAGTARVTHRPAGHDSQRGTGSAAQHPAALAAQHPAALLHGAGHIVVHGNPPFRALFGSGCLGLPAAEALLDLPRAAFDLMDLVYRDGRPLARWITVRGAPWRLTIAERRDIGTGEVYGIALHLVPQEDLSPRPPSR